MSFDNLKPQVIDEVIVRITLDGSFQRAKLYKEKISDEDKKNQELYSD